MRQYFAGWLKVAEFIGRFRSLRRKAILANVCGGLSSAFQFAIPLATIRIINEVVPHKDTRLLVSLALIIAAAAVAAVLMSYLESNLASVFRERATVKLEAALFENTQAQPYQFFKQHESGYIMSRILNDAGTTMGVLMSMTTLGRSTVWLPGGLILLPMFHLKLGLLIAAMLPVYFLLLL